MSYILDALTKADYERQRETGQDCVPGLHTVHAYLLPPPAASAKLRRHLVAGIGVAGLALVTGWHLWSPRPAPEPTAAAIPKSLAPTPDRVTPREPAPLARSTTDRPASISAHPSSPAIPPRAHAKPPAAASPSAAAAPAPTPTARPTPVARSDRPPPSSTPTSEPRSPARVLHVAELPPSLQRELPKLAVSGFANTDSTDMRMAIVNDRALREGDLAAGGVRVEAITDQGVIFGYRGYRFRVGSP